MTYSQSMMSRMKGVETYSNAAAFSILIGAGITGAAGAAGAGGVSSLPHENLFYESSSSSTTNFEHIQFPLIGNQYELLPVLPSSKHKIKAKVQFVNSIEFSKDQFD